VTTDRDQRGAGIGAGPIKNSSRSWRTTGLPFGTGERGRGYAGTLPVVAACTGLALLMQGRFAPSNLIMVYLVGVVVSAIAFGRGPAMLAALLSVGLFDFLFVPPRFTLRVADTQYLVTFAVMLLVAVVIGTLTASLREQLEGSRLRERRNAALYRLSRDLAVRSDERDVLAAATERIAEMFEAETAVLLLEGGVIRVAAGEPRLLEAGDPAFVRQACESGQPVTAPGRDGRAGVLHLPLETSGGIVGVLSVRPEEDRTFDDAERFQLARALAGQTALALERCRLAKEAETERARSSLLSSVSHDLRTPLAAITGAASSLSDPSSGLSPEASRELTTTIGSEAMRLNRLVGNLLDMTRLEARDFRAKKDWHSLEEVVGAALHRLGDNLGEREIRLSLDPALPLIPLDDVLFEKVVWNLVENAARYAPSGPIEIAASTAGGRLRFEVRDRGPGIPAGDESRIFEKFHRGANAVARDGSGLGLAISAAIVEAHGGAIEAIRRPGGGTIVSLTLPIDGAPPDVENENNGHRWETGS
jgi:two-component system sensor histidine kinase KdpD